MFSNETDKTCNELQCMILVNVEHVNRIQYGSVIEIEQCRTNEPLIKFKYDEQYLVFFV